MVNLFDIVRQAQSGAAVNNMSRQFGLPPDQTQRAIEALLPAFSLGFQRSLQNPASFAGLMEMMSSGRFAPFYDHPTQPHLATPNGQQVLERLFGSSEVSRQIAAQAASMTGIGTQVLQQMLPSVAAMLMGGLFRFATVEGLSEFLRNSADWLQRLGPQQPSPPPAPSPAAGTPYGAWTDLMGGMLGGATARPSPAPNAQMTDPWSGLMQAWTAGMPPAESAPPPPKPPASQPNPFEVLSRMFETGREAQAQYMADLQGIMDGFWRTPQAGHGRQG